MLSIRNLHTHFATPAGPAPVVDGVSFELAAGKTLALVGESGCGKSVTALSIMRLLPQPIARIVSGTISFEGGDIARLPERQMRSIRGRRIAMVFQEPMTSLNPVLTVGAQIGEAYALHQRSSRRAARIHAIEMLRRVGIADPARRCDAFPHEMSGGMRQRVMIAIALCCRPAVLIADEPTTALDVTIQAQILNLLRELQIEFGMSVLLITHDLGVAARVADDICVMYAGRIVESGPVSRVFSAPRHPYTRALFDSIPRSSDSKRRLSVIPGSVPNPAAFPAGCRFHPRCAIGADDPICRSQDQQLQLLDDASFDANRPHLAACWKAEFAPHAQV